MNIHYVSLNNKMAPPPKEQRVDERIAYFADQGLLEEKATLEEKNQKQLTQQGISYLEDR